MVVGAEQDLVVVVGCDGSWESLEAVDVAVEEARRRRLGLVLLTVEDGPDSARHSLGDWSRSSVEGALLADAIGCRALDRVAGRVPATAVVAAAVDSCQLDGLVARTTVLVVGRHGSRGLGAFASGTTSERLLRRMQVPVLVAGPQPGAVAEHGVAAPHPVVVVGVDDEPGAAVVLRVAVEEAQVRGWGLTVVHAVRRTDTELPVLARKVWERHGDLLLAQRSPDHSLARVVVEVEAPVAALVSHAGPRDLVVVGTHGEGCLAGLIGGSVARGVLDQMPCDVLVVPSEARLSN